MAESFELGGLLGHVHTLKDGTPVRLRLARSSDAPAVRALLRGLGHDGAELKAARLVHFDPRRQYVLCATGLVESRETLLGIGVITFESAGNAEPDLLLVERDADGELKRLLASALLSRARAVRAA